MITDLCNYTVIMLQRVMYLFQPQETAFPMMQYIHNNITIDIS